MALLVPSQQECLHCCYPPGSGIRFDPSDHVLVKEVLMAKINGCPISKPLIPDINDMYDLHPGEVFMKAAVSGGPVLDKDGMTEKEQRYFYTKLKSVSNKDGGKRKNRKAGSWGTWKEKSCKRSITMPWPCNEEVIGYSRYLKYWPQHNNLDNRVNDDSVEWSVNEFSLLEHNYLPHNQDTVLCRITKKVQKLAKKVQKLTKKVQELGVPHYLMKRGRSRFIIIPYHPSPGTRAEAGRSTTHSIDHQTYPSVVNAHTNNFKTSSKFDNHVPSSMNFYLLQQQQRQQLNMSAEESTSIHEDRESDVAAVTTSINVDNGAEMNHDLLVDTTNFNGELVQTYLTLEELGFSESDFPETPSLPYSHPQI